MSMVYSFFFFRITRSAVGIANMVQLKMFCVNSWTVISNGERVAMVSSACWNWSMDSYMPSVATWSMVVSMS